MIQHDFPFLGSHEGHQAAWAGHQAALTRGRAELQVLSACSLSAHSCIMRCRLCTIGDDAGHRPREPSSVRTRAVSGRPRTNSASSRPGPANQRSSSQPSSVPFTGAPNSHSCAAPVSARPPTGAYAPRSASMPVALPRAAVAAPSAAGRPCRHASLRREACSKKEGLRGVGSHRAARLRRDRAAREEGPTAVSSWPRRAPLKHSL